MVLYILIEVLGFTENRTQFYSNDQAPTAFNTSIGSGIAI